MHHMRGNQAAQHTTTTWLNTTISNTLFNPYRVVTNRTLKPRIPQPTLRYTGLFTLYPFRVINKKHVVATHDMRGRRGNQAAQHNHQQYSIQPLQT